MYIQTSIDLFSNNLLDDVKLLLAFLRQKIYLGKVFYQDRIFL